jgi:hypothetical protein
LLVLEWNYVLNRKEIAVDGGSICFDIYIY